MRRHRRRSHGRAGSASRDASPGGALRPGDAATIDRRTFTATLALAGAALLGRPGRADPDGGEDAVKQHLRAIKDLACELSEYLDANGLDGPLESAEDIGFVADRVHRLAWKAQRLLTSRWSEVFAPPEFWLYWMPPDASGMSLRDAGYASCEAACEALERYCEEMENGGSDYEPAAHALWTMQSLLCHVLSIAGIEP